MKIAYVLLRFPSLTETFIAEEIQKIQGAGVEVIIYSLLPPTEELVQPVSKSLLHLRKTPPGILHPAIWYSQLRFLIRNPKTYFNTLFSLVKQPAPKRSLYLKRVYIFLKSVWIANDLRNKDCQLVHSHFAWLSAGGGWIVSRLLCLPFTVTAHAFDIFTERNDLLPLIADQAAKIITISDFNKTKIHEICPDISKEKVQVVRCGIDLNLFRRMENQSKQINNPIQITSVGSLIEKKGHEFLVSACEILQKQGLNLNCVIIGTGDLEQKLHQQIVDKGLSNTVALAGKRSQDWIRDRLNQTDFFILACVVTPSSDQDGIPVAMMEAMGMGVPVISTRVSGIPEIIHNEFTGLLVNEKDAGAIADAVIRLIKDPHLRQSLIKNGLELVNQEYNIHHNVKKLMLTFSEVIDRRCLNNPTDDQINQISDTYGG